MMSDNLREFYHRTAVLHEELTKNRPDLFNPYAEQSPKMKKLLALAEQMNKCKQMLEDDQSEVLVALESMKQRINAVSKMVQILTKTPKTSRKKRSKIHKDELKANLGEHQSVVCAEHAEVLCEKHFEYLHKKYSGKLQKLKANPVNKKQDEDSEHHIKSKLLDDESPLQSRNALDTKTAYPKDNADQYQLSTHIHDEAVKLDSFETFPSQEQFKTTQISPILEPRAEFKSIAVQTDAVVLCDNCRIPISTTTVQQETQNRIYKNQINSNKILVDDFACESLQHGRRSVEVVTDPYSLHVRDAHNLTFYGTNVKLTGAREQDHSDHLQRRHSLGGESLTDSRSFIAPLHAGAKAESFKRYDSLLLDTSKDITLLKSYKDNSERLANTEATGFISDESSHFSESKPGTLEHYSEHHFKSKLLDTQSVAPQNLERFEFIHQFSSDSSRTCTKNNQFLVENSMDYYRKGDGFSHTISENSKLPIQSHITEELGSVVEKVSNNSMKSDNILEKQQRKESRCSMNHEYSFLEADSKSSSLSFHGCDYPNTLSKLQKSDNDVTIETSLKGNNVWKQEDSPASLTSSECKQNASLNRIDQRIRRQNVRNDSPPKLEAVDYHGFAQKETVTSSSHQDFENRDLFGVEKFTSRKESVPTIFPAIRNECKKEDKEIPDTLSSVSEAETNDNEIGGPLSATDAFQKLIGNNSMARKNESQEYVESDSDSDADDAEKALSAALSASGPNRRLTTDPVSKVKGKLSEATMKALGFSPELIPKTSLASTKATVKQEEDSDEFDFYD